MYTRRGYEGTEATSLSIETPCRTGALCHASQHCVCRRLTRDPYAAGRQATMTKELKKRHTAVDRVTSCHVASLALHFYHTPTTRPVNEHYSRCTASLCSFACGLERAPKKKSSSNRGTFFQGRTTVRG